MVPETLFSSLCKHKELSQILKKTSNSLCAALLQLYAEESFTDAASEAALHGKPALDLLRQIGVKIFL